MKPLPRDNGALDRPGSEQVGERVRIYQRGNVWWANFQHGKKQFRQSLKTRSKKQARLLALRIEAQVSAGGWQPAAEPAGIAEAIAAYREVLGTEGRAAKTLSKYVKVFERVAVLADDRKVRNLAGVDLRFIDAYKAQRKTDGAAAKTLYTETVIIRQLINFALSRNMINTDPLKGLKFKKPKPAEQPCWTRPQVLQILEASPAEIQPLLTLLADTGMRIGEAAWLTWEDVQIATENSVIRIRSKDGWKPKTGDERAVPISPMLVSVLTGLPRRCRWVVTMPPSKYQPATGRQWTERRALQALKRVLERLGLPGKLHTFRHSFISHALLKNVPEAVVRQWVGHVDDEVIRHYTHVHGDASQSEMQKLAAADRPGPAE
jgi:site-specific recombinase XerD